MTLYEPRPVGASASLVSHPWPGNVRELKNAIQVAAATAAVGAIEISPCDLPPAIQILFSTTAEPAMEDDESVPKVFRPIAQEVDELVRRRMVSTWAASSVRPVNGRSSSSSGRARPTRSSPRSRCHEMQI